MRHSNLPAHLMLVSALLAPAAPALAQTPPPSTPPAADRPIDDAWLGTAVLDELAKVPPDDRPKFANTVQVAMLARLCCGHVDQLAALNDMMYALKACVYLPEAAKATGDETLGAWLLAHRPVARLLFRALGQVRSREDAFQRMAELVAGAEAAVLAYPELAVALADDLRDRGEKEDALKLYEQAALQNIKIAEIVVTAAARAEAILAEQDRRDVAIKFYTQLFRQTKKHSSPFRAHTANYQIGARLAALLRQAGNVRAAEQVERSL